MPSSYGMGLPPPSLSSGTVPPMFIRRTQTRSLHSGHTYFTHRLVRSHRLSGKVRQQTLLNLGRNFSIPREDWPLLCRRLDQILTGQLPLLPVASTPLEEEAAWPSACLRAKPT